MKLPLFLLALLVVAQAALAQVTVELDFDQKQYLPGETVMARVRVGNQSGQTLALGEAADWLTFEVQSHDGLFVERQRTPDVLGAFKLESSTIATKKVNLAPAFHLARAGRYRVTATVLVSAWDRRWSSKEVSFDVIKGTKLWERDFGLTNSTGGQPEMRKFSLLEARYLERPTLYARLTDAAEREVLAVRPIGPLLGFSQPDGQIDRRNCLHVLWQDGARTYSYVTLASGGELTLRHTYQMTETRPTLRPAAEGGIQIVGGQRVATLRDIPPNSAALPAPAASKP